ncbi:hypothetical protein GQ42DRAFT_161021 [Ramicandelaber brevisporus]|nr:hypothetical protein GQ42DRAFT_161021 [Ramicandelaber brevisporus]
MRIHAASFVRCSLSFFGTPPQHTALPKHTHSLPRLLSSIGVVPSLSPGVCVCWCGVRSRVVVVPLPPGWCGWHLGFPSGMFHLFPLLSWFVPSSVGFLPHLLLAVAGRWLSSSEGGCVGCQHLFPRCCRHAMFFFFGSVRYSS